MVYGNYGKYGTKKKKNSNMIPLVIQYHPACTKNKA